MRPSPATLAALLALSGPALAEDPPAEAPAEAAAPAPAPVTYKLGQGMLVVKVFKDASTLASDLSHDHAIKAVGWSGSFTWDPVDQTCTVEATVPVAKLEPDADATRSWAGLEGSLSESQREEIKGNMLKPDQLHGSRFPTISFKGDSCALSGSTLKLTGELSVRGRARRVTIPLGGFSADAGGLKGKGAFKVKATDFGFEPFSALFGALKNQDEMEFVVQLDGRAG